jgi:uncharacterized protein YndB with AHSA1/START domain
MTSATATRSLVVEREMPHSPEKIWQRTHPRRVDRRVADEERFPAGDGSSIPLRSTPMPPWNGILDCEVLAVEPNKRLAYTWNASGEEAANGPKTVANLEER